MPLFDFECEECGQTLIDHLCAINDDDKPICEKCKQPMKKIFTAGGHFKLKGRGFHNTDYPNCETSR